MLFGIAHVTVTGKQPVDDNAVIYAINTRPALYRIGKSQRAGYVFQA